jgi:hypothetical protein
MASWTDEELSLIGGAHEVQIAGRREDGTLRSPVIIWVVRRGNSLYIRSVNGREAAWFRGTQVRHEGQILAGGVAKDVTFVEAAHDIDDELDAAYRAKYGRSYGIDQIVATPARGATLEIVPR